MSGMLVTARKLLSGQPTPTDTRRAASSAYYAIFHHLCDKICHLLVCNDGELQRARYQAYRSVEHGTAKSACLECSENKDFPIHIVEYAETFVALQQRRHDADYDPNEDFSAASAQALITRCEDAIAAFDLSDEKHQRAFVVMVALRKRGRG
jgi:hypothetical protein